jgi:hypothetical protein
MPIMVSSILPNLTLHGMPNNPRRGRTDNRGDKSERKRHTLTKESAESGFLAWASRSGAPLGDESGAVEGVFRCKEKMWMVPLSLDTASQSGLSPLEKARLYIQAGSAPLRSSCACSHTRC